MSIKGEKNNYNQIKRTEDFRIKKTEKLKLKLKVKKHNKNNNKPAKQQHHLSFKFYLGSLPPLETGEASRQTSNKTTPLAKKQRESQTLGTTHVIPIKKRRKKQAEDHRSLPSLCSQFSDRRMKKGGGVNAV